MGLGFRVSESWILGVAAALGIVIAVYGVSPNVKPNPTPSAVEVWAMANPPRRVAEPRP